MAIMIKNKKPAKINKKILIPIVVAVLLIGGSLLWYFAIRPQDKTSDVGTKNQTTDQQGEFVNLDPPTEQDKKDVDAHKDELTNNTDSTPPQGQKRKVTPIITNASAQGVYAYIPEIFEEGGICKFSFSSGGDKFEKTSTGFQNAQNTGCAPLNIDQNAFPKKGNWSVVLTYSSTNSEGASQAYTFEVK